MKCSKKAEFVFFEYEPKDGGVVQCRIHYLCPRHKDIVAAVLPDARIEPDLRKTVPCGSKE